jgi:hypothetical protein
MTLDVLIMRPSKIRTKLAGMAAFDLLRSPDGVKLLDDGLAELVEEWTDLMSMRQIAAKKHGVLTPPPSLPVNTVAEPAVARKSVDEIAALRPFKARKGSSVAALYELLDDAKTGITHDDLRELYSKLENVRKKAPYYSAVEQLRKRGHCVGYKGRIFTPQNKFRFEQDVATGRALDIVEKKPTEIAGKWANNVLKYLRERGDWASVAEITKHVTEMPDYSGSPNPHVQVCVALRNLRNKYGVVEKEGRPPNSRWRAKPQGNGAAHEAEENDSEIERATEGDLLSVARH